jgi:hypothetical protein
MVLTESTQLKIINAKLDRLIAAIEKLEQIATPVAEEEKEGDGYRK